MFVAACTGSSRPTSNANAEIEKLFNQYAAYVDQGDWDRLVGLYTRSPIFSMVGEGISCLEIIREMPDQSQSGMELIECSDNEKVTVRVEPGSLDGVLIYVINSVFDVSGDMDGEEDDVDFDVQTEFSLADLHIYGSGNNRTVSAEFVLKSAKIFPGFDEFDSEVTVSAVFQFEVAKSNSVWRIHKHVFPYVP